MSDAVATTGPAGVRFRSRLEARWAAFFDLIRLPWQYEPEIGLNRWIPDFALTCGTGMLVEVKPAVTLAQLEPHKIRIENSRAIAPVWLVGAALAFGTGDDPALGLFGFCGMGTTWLWREMTLLNLTEQTGLLHWRAFTKTEAFGLVQRRWVVAGNELQWRRG